jgi:hypothetical protein
LNFVFKSSSNVKHDESIANSTIYMDSIFPKQLNYLYYSLLITYSLMMTKLYHKFPDKLTMSPLGNWILSNIIRH